jgi:hypothetical protein
VANSDGTTPMSYVNWASGSPVDATVYDCVYYYAPNNHWYDHGCQLINVVFLSFLQLCPKLFK